MDFLGIGPLELVFIMVIALIVLGPRDIARFARNAGRALNRIYRSEAWGAINKASREFRNLPNRLAREAALDDLDESIRKAGKPSEEKGSGEGLSAWQPSPKSSAQGETAEAEPVEGSNQESSESQEVEPSAPPSDPEQEA
jgi:sec-independent protein translocase protein TatB